MTRTVPVFIHKRSDLPSHMHVSIVGEALGDSRTPTHHKLIISSIKRTAQASAHLSIEEDIKPSIGGVDRDLLALISKTCNEDDLYVILAHNDAQAFDELDLMLLDSLGEDFEFSRDELAIYIVSDGSFMGTFHALYFSELV